MFQLLAFIRVLCNFFLYFSVLLSPLCWCHLQRSTDTVKPYTFSDCRNGSTGVPYMMLMPDSRMEKLEVLV